MVDLSNLDFKAVADDFNAWKMRGNGLSVTEMKELLRDKYGFVDGDWAMVFPMLCELGLIISSTNLHQHPDVRSNIK